MHFLRGVQKWQKWQKWEEWEEWLSPELKMVPRTNEPYGLTALPKDLRKSLMAVDGSPSGATYN